MSSYMPALTKISPNAHEILLCVHIRVACVQVFTILRLLDHLLATVGLKSHIHSVSGLSPRSNIVHCNQASGPYSNTLNNIDWTRQTTWKREQVEISGVRGQWNLWDNVSDSLQACGTATNTKLLFFSILAEICAMLKHCHATIRFLLFRMRISYIAFKRYWIICKC